MFFVMTTAQDAGFDLVPFLEQLWLWFQVIFGIGLMIFIHELGHFAAAKKIGVKVEAFSLGFGPRLLGFRRGDTDYRLSAIPLGGYVKMTGENPDEPRTGAPDELQSRSAWERMIIFSAGVFLNFLFAFITIPIIFAVGVPFMNPQIGTVMSGGPAWRAGILPGDRILEVNGNTIYEYSDIPLNIALGNRDKNTLLIERGDERFLVDVVPVKNEEEGRYQILVEPATRYTVTVDRNSPAARAGLCEGDRILSINGKPPAEWSTQGSLREGESLNIEAERNGSNGGSIIRATVIPDETVSKELFRIGIQPRINYVRGLRRDLALRRDGLAEGDFILKINGRDISSSKDLDHALAEPSEGAFLFEIQRSGKLAEVTYPSSMQEALKEDLAVISNGESNSVVITAGGALEALGDSDVRNGMHVWSVNGKKTETYFDIQQIVNEASDTRFELSVDLPGGGGEKSVVVEARPVHEYHYGFHFLYDFQKRQLSILDAFKAGLHCSLYMVKTCYLTLSRIITGDVGSKNIGGIITIGKASYSFAKLGLARLFFFLAILSINLGFLNILPIPILDGGHLLFLLIEKIKGSPVNEKVMGYSQIVGLALILLLLIYVTWNDILRLLN